MYALLRTHKVGLNKPENLCTALWLVTFAMKHGLAPYNVAYSLMNQTM